MTVMKENKLVELSMEFSVDIINLVNQLRPSPPKKKEHLSTKTNVLFLNDVCLRQMMQGVAL